jgi:predicted DsbA family dithiol-disulfide isomerase
VSVDFVEVFADIVCPFAHVGLRRFVARRHELGSVAPRLRVRAWPLELVNRGPFDPDAVAHHVDELRRQVAPELFAHFTREAVPATSLPAFALVASAYRQGDDIGERASLAVRAALFDDGRDVSDPAVLTRIAIAHAIPEPDDAARAAYERDYAEGRRRGVAGSPHFFLGDRDYFCPALRIDRSPTGVTITPAPERLDAFLDDCFSGRARPIR